MHQTRARLRASVPPSSPRFSKVLSEFLGDQLRICSTPSAFRSGSVVTEDVWAVLDHGNTRERCAILANILTRRQHLVQFIAEAAPADTCPMVSRAAARRQLHAKNAVCNGRLVRSNVNVSAHLRQQTWSRVGAPEGAAPYCQRTSRSTVEKDRARSSFALTAEQIVPPLSAREQRVVRVGDGRGTLRSWCTGHMSWQVPPLCIFVRTLGHAIPYL